MHNLEAIYQRILKELRKISSDQLLTYQRRVPKMSDLELISLCLTSEYLGIDSENDLFRKLPASFNQKIERTVFNRRKRKLFGALEVLRKKLAHSITKQENVFIVDSMPLEICKL